MPDIFNYLAAHSLVLGGGIVHTRKHAVKIRKLLLKGVIFLHNLVKRLFDSVKLCQGIHFICDKVLFMLGYRIHKILYGMELFSAVILLI